jgi:GT2 family glycosyltransferase
MQDHVRGAQLVKELKSHYPAMLLVLVFSLILTMILKSPEISTLSIPELSRILQFPAVREYLDALLGFRYPQIFFDNLGQRLFSCGDWSSLEVSPKSLTLGSRVRFLLIGSALDVSVIVPTWNEEKYLPKCLHSLNTQAGRKPLEVIVVDGGSTDRTVEIARDHADEVLVEPHKPVGAARNVGARKASGNVLAFIDADTTASENWIEEIERTLKMNALVVGVTGPTQPDEGTRLDHLAYHVATGWVQRLSLKLGLPHVAGFNCAYKKDGFWEAGGFDERRQLSEDIMLSLKIRHQGPILFNPQMLAYTSLRRIKDKGYPYLTTYYAMNWVTMLFFNRTLGYPKIR